MLKQLLIVLKKYFPYISFNVCNLSHYLLLYPLWCHSLDNLSRSNLCLSIRQADSAQRQQLSLKECSHFVMLDGCISAASAPSSFTHTPDCCRPLRCGQASLCLLSLSCAFYSPIEMLLDTTWGFQNCFCSGPMKENLVQDCRFITIADNPRVYISIETFLFLVYIYV